ncbi:formylglycine-generating enzyme family protein [Mesotoga sp.]|uniref:formylglycine-generating enzyme family protein n=1 Tax=Mesotoga sp. TaxID=2053577 RepID=UPI00345E7F34
MCFHYGVHYKYLGSDNSDEIAWYFGNSGYKTHEVGTKAPNNLWIYDMSGNVWEWCSDWHGVARCDERTGGESQRRLAD